ncbi:Trk system potassium transporter TrkA [Methanohalophilus portucalensis]|uniref:Trk system potassium transporter TrkA n=2 Tax=Methanohalophilus portucalensis TaxID=39664 RepID=A0A1L9C312_9EURY|nr:Trk system potassium transporter TrkA [Methanohalophilus portucalensis]ATU07612.1 Trk system potassium transport protein TrkA [Methanohalophilus portucalensis]OJH48905.1 TrkA-N domain protein [Methanohalophilus portucalensis FDF-1]RNI10337.1 Trk system potassium transporter TrkA [Methanohalophilus portucalensis FDF-1]SMH37525.1 trk system potassium uptake protein TrkA [Methanohalophilus portucalensis FDF-1]
MKIIVIGAGEVGYHIAKSLYLENDLVIIDEDEDACLRVDEFDVQVIRGNGANAAILEKVLIGADLLVAVTGDDEVNIVSCMAAKLIKQSNKNFKTMARVSNPDYIDRPVAKRTQVGIDVMVCPELALASEVADILSIPSAIDSESFADGKVKMMEFVVKDNSNIAGKHLRDVDLLDCCIVSALFRGSQLIIPHGEDIIQAGDHIVIIGKTEAMKDISSFFGEINKSRSRVMIIGGGVVGFYLAQLLENTRLNVKIIEKGRQRSEMVADNLQKALVLRGDGSDLNLLKEEGVGEMDVVISVTDSDEKNLLCSLMAKQLGAKKVIVRADHFDYVPLFEMVGVDRAVSPREATVNEVLKLTMGTGIEALTTIEGEKAEIIEYTVSRKSRVTGKLLKDVNFPDDSLVSMVVHGGVTIIPRGNYRIREGDHLLVFSLPTAHQAVEKLFK